MTISGLANRHGRTVADVIAFDAGLSASEPEAADDAVSTAIIGVFTKTVAMVGWSERQLVAAGRAIPAYAAKCPAVLNALKSPAARRIWHAVLSPTPGIDVKT